MARLPACSKPLANLPPYLFVKLNSVKEEALRRGKELIDLGMGNPDRPTPGHVVEALCRTVREDASTHRYPTTQGTRALRRAVAAWYSRRFGVTLDPDREVLPLLGSKEGLTHLFFSYLSSSDAALIPSPCYPAHYNGTLLTGTKVHLMPLTEENAFLPELGRVPRAVASRAKVLLLNYPNNPTGAVVPDLKLFEECIRFARRHGCLVAHDNAYSELTFGGYVAPSFLQVPGAREVGVEFHSLSKTYSMAGWRVAFAVGNSRVLANLAKFKSFVDYGIPNFIQKAAAEALSGPQDYVAQIREVYRRRRDVLVRRLNAAGWAVEVPRATMYLWARLPTALRAGGSFAFAQRLILEEGVVVAPGIGFGPGGEGYVRFALVDDEPRIEEAVRRIGRFLSSPGSPSKRRPKGRGSVLPAY